MGGLTAIAFSALALARGADVDELDAIWKCMKDWAAPVSPSDAIRDIDKGIHLVREAKGRTTE